jgi:hypothetical protein
VFCAANGYAFKVQYGNFFTIKRVAVKQGVLVLPLTRAEYEDVRILDKATFETVKSCAALGEKETCPLTAADMQLSAGQIVRLPAEQGCRWQVPVIFNRQWVVLVLVSWDGMQYKFIYPSSFVFTAQAGRKEKAPPSKFEKQVADFIQHKLKEVQTNEMCARADR